MYTVYVHVCVCVIAQADHFKKYILQTNKKAFWVLHFKTIEMQLF